MFLQESDLEELREFFADRLVRPVKYVVFSQDRPSIHDPLPIQHELCTDAVTLLGEILPLSEKLSLNVLDVNDDPLSSLRYDVEKVPAIAILGQEDHGLRFYGVPSNFEFITFLEITANVSAGQTDLCDSTLRALEEIRQPVHIQVFYTPSCALCPLMTHLAMQFAIASPWIRCDTIDAAEFPQLAENHNVRGAPHIVLNGNQSIVGVKQEKVLLKIIRQAASMPCPVVKACSNGSAVK